jgi:transposase
LPGKQRDHLFTFLERSEVPATNNLAERQLRPAVIARKISCGNKTEKGARAWAVLASLAATCRQTGHSLIHSISSRVQLQPTRGP